MLWETGALHCYQDCSGCSILSVNQSFLVRLKRQSDMIMLVSEVCGCVSGKVPCIENSKHQIVAISKHLCGAATGELWQFT